MSQAISYILTIPTATNVGTMTLATPLSQPYAFIPPTLSLTLTGPGAATTSLPIEFPVASVISSGSEVHTSIGFTTYSNAAAVSAAASAARSYFQHSLEISSSVPTAILSETAPLSVPGVISTLVSTASPSALSTSTFSESTVASTVTTAGGTSTTVPGTSATSTSSSTSSDEASTSAATKAAPTKSSSVKNTSMKKFVAAVSILVLAANTLC